MLRARKLSLAGLAVGALELTISTSVPLSYGHGYTTAPISRANNRANGTVQDCGQIPVGATEHRGATPSPGT